MSQASDAWYVRLPDGRVIRARSTESVRHHLRTGRIPLDCWVRRSPEEEWATLEWMQEFSDQVHELTQARAHPPESRGGGLPRAASIAARLDPLQLETVGIRGAVEELLAALDSTMVRVKLRVAGVTGLLAGAAFALMYLYIAHVRGEAPWWSWPVFGGVVLLAGSACQVLLTQMTYAEVSQLRPARWRDGLIRFPLAWCHVVLANAIVFGLTVSALVFLRLGPEQFRDWYMAQYGEARLEAFRDLVAVGSFLGELLLWPVLAFGLLLAPLVIVEDRSAPLALWQWLRLLVRHLGEVFLYQSVALSMAIMVTLPLGLTLALATWGMARGQAMDQELRALVHVFAGVALTPFLAYLIVANLFVYLHVRFDVAQRKR